MFSRFQKKAGSGKSLERVAECLYRMPSSGRYYGQTRVQGKLLRQSLKTSDRKLAERRLDDFLKKAGRLKPGSGKITFGDLYQKWKELVLASSPIKESSKDDREYSIEAIFRCWSGLKTLPVRDITRDACEQWLAKRRVKISPQRINHELASLKMLLKYACEKGIILDNPSDGLKRAKIPKLKPLIPTKDQFASLVQMLRKRGNPDAADFVELLGYSGMRRNEAAFLAWGNIDFERNQFTITAGETGTKNSEQRTIPLFPALRRLLERIKKERGNVDPSETVMRIKECRGAIESACKKAELPHFSHHHMRHFFCSNAVEHGVDFKTVGQWCGHKDGGMLVAKTYSHLREEHSKMMASKMTFDATSQPENVVQFRKQGTM